MQSEAFDDTTRAPEQRRTAPVAATSPNHERVPLRLLGGKTTVVLELPIQMSERAWEQMITMLNALKPGYVAEEEDGES